MNSSKVFWWLFQGEAFESFTSFIGYIDKRIAPLLYETLVTIKIVFLVGSRLDPMFSNKSTFTIAVLPYIYQDKVI